MMIFCVAVLFVTITFPISARDLKKNIIFMKIFDYGKYINLTTIIIEIHFEF